MARIYQTWCSGDAHVHAALVEDPGRADLLVYRVLSWGEAIGDAYWYITRNRQDASVCIYFDSIGMSEIRVCFVNTRGMAGWRTPHRLKGRFR